MLVFLDTEFTDFIDCELISLGLAAADGRDFYAEVSDYDTQSCNAFVRAAVLPKLGRDPGQIFRRSELGPAVRRWLLALGEPVHFACDNSTDWDLLVDLFDGELLSNVQGRYDLSTMVSSPIFQKGVCEYHASPGRPWHHALHDACALRAGWLLLADGNASI
jgi:hypothetical protein